MTPPDIRDGLDAPSRDCLSQLGDRYVKSAKIARDEQTYEALVRLVQDFRLRYPLVDGRGNFGSVDADPPAEAQYTEVRLSPLGRELARFPNLLVNGSSTIPPHNLVEVADAVIAVLDDPALDLEGLMEHLPGPDFPSGGVIDGPIREVYETGRGLLRLCGRAHVEDGTIVVTELPYGVEKGADEGVIREIVECLVDGKLPGIDDIQDHTDRRGMRLLIGFEDGTDPHDLLDRLYATTSMEITVPVDFIALVDGAPERFTLRALIDRFLEGRDPDAVRRELPELARRHGDERRTSIVRD